jgi:glycosyltransferase involved in cell wall biosynthesis
MSESEAFSLSVFFPAYNDAKSLPELLERTFEVVPKLTSDYEVIIIDDGSTDETAAVLANLSERYAPTLRIITHSSNRGYGAALKTGFSACTKDLVFYTDGDGQYDVRELEALWQRMRSDIDVVNGYKLNRGDGRTRAVIGNTYNWIIRHLFNIEIRDVDCDFRLIRRAVLNEFQLLSHTGSICLELVKKLQNIGARFDEVGVHHYRRAHGRSQYFRLNSVVATLFQLLMLYPSLSIGSPQNARDKR